tara:strand:- start:152 stop:979 length:828 start_codon:yes stop_codon:yes gene_type:complete
MITHGHFMEILPSIHKICIKAGNLQKKYHKTKIYVTTKSNKTPVTKIDIDSNNIILKSLSELTPDIPIISEEEYDNQKKYDSFWIIDPLDGTRDYLESGNNFCICISLIDKKFPILGIIYSPITEDFYYAYKNYGAYLMKGHSKAIKIMTKKMSLHDKNNVYTSISINKNVLKEISDNVDNALFIPLASALKFGAIASGNGCFYPRLGPTHEWDTAAGQCLIEEAGGSVVDKFMNRLEYNKNPNFLNEEFFVIADTDYNWKKIIDNIIRSRKVRI